MEATTMSRLNSCHSLQELAVFLKDTEAKLGFLGGRRFQHVDCSHSVSMRAIVSKFKTLCRETPEGSVSEGEMRGLRQRIELLNTAGSRLLESAPWWKKILTYIFRIANIRFFFENPITVADNEAAALTEKINRLLQETTASISKNLIPQDQCSKITSPALYKELLLNIIHGKSIEESLQLIGQQTIPESNQGEFIAVRDVTKQELWTTKAAEYAERLAQEPPPGGKELSTIRDFFQNYIGKIFSIENKDLNKKELTSALHFFASIKPSARPSNRMKRLIAPFEKDIIHHFCFLVRLWTDEAYKIGHPKLLDFLSDLFLYYNDVNDFFPQSLETTAEWKALQTTLSEIYEQFFCNRKFFSQEHPLILSESPLRLSDGYSFGNKRDINAWLKSLQEAKTVVDDLFRELGHGITIGTGQESQLITRVSLEQEIGKLPTNDEDIKCLLCWHVHQKIVAYLQNKGVPNPGEEANVLLSIANQTHPSYPFLQQLGGLINRVIITLSDEPHNWIFFYDVATKTPAVQVHSAYADEGKTVQTAITLRAREEGTFTEMLVFTPGS